MAHEPYSQPIGVSAGAHSDVGLRRAINEDSMLAEFPVYLVADGMGGHDAGDRASAAVIREFQRLVGRDNLTPLDVVDALSHAHAVVRALAETTERGAGSTVAGVVLVHQDGEPRWLTFNLGDSRVYRLFGDELEQLTVDHSIVQELVEQGKITRDEVGTYKGRNVITRAVGADDGEADYWLSPIVTGERLLICSDGLTGEVSDEGIRAGLSMSGSTDDAARNLVQQAVTNGGRDNVTVVVLDVQSGGLSADSEDVTGSPRDSETSIIDEIEGTTVTTVTRRVRRV